MAACTDRRLIFFDFDGVIVESLPRMLEIWREACASVGSARMPEEEDLRTLREMSVSGTFNHVGLAESSRETYERVFDAALDADKPPSPLVNGIASVLMDLAQQNCLILVTSNRRKAVDRTFEAARLSECFTDILSRDCETSKEKQIAAALAKRPKLGSDAILVGDAISDLEAAQRAGIAAVAVTWGYQRQAFIAEHFPDASFVTSPTDLAAYLSR